LIRKETSPILSISLALINSFNDQMACPLFSKY
jgi:hypothetical protein